MRKNLNIIVVLLWSVHYSTSSVHDDNHEGYLFDNQLGYVLFLPASMTNVTQMTTKVPDKMDCVLTCIGTPWCLSVNFKLKSESDGRHVCEVIASDKNASAEYLKKNENYTHLSIKNPCDEKPCVNGGLCTRHHNRKDSCCQCKHGFTGDICQDIDQLVLGNTGGAGQWYRDMEGWHLSARFSNVDDKNWMTADGLWWYDLMTVQGNITNPSVNLDMISPAFWSVNGSDIKITRSDDPTHAALLRTTSNCMRSGTFRSMLSSYGNFRNGVVWAKDKCLGSCSVVYGGNYASTYGFAEAACNGDIQSSGHIGFWCDYGAGDGSVMMIGGGGSACSRADHGIGITEENEAKLGKIATSSTRDFGDISNNNNLGYALNLWIK